MNTNSILILACLGLFIISLLIAYSRAKKKTTTTEVTSYNTIEKVLEAVKNEMVDIVHDDFTLGLSDEEFERLYKRKARVNEALKNCVFGIDSAKILVIDLIRTFIVDKIPENQVTALLGLDEDSEPSSHVKFEILMYKYKKLYSKDALVKWIDKYDLGREREATDAGRVQDKSYFITEDDLNYTYQQEHISLSMDEQIDILAVLVYQLYKGFGIVDTLREMNVNGFNMGTSGSILSATNKQRAMPPEYLATNAVWLYDRGKYIHLRFMNYGSEEELKRIIQLMIRWGNPGPLTSKRGYLVNTMYDKSRVLAMRPPASEYWAIFVRKFTLADESPEALLDKHYTKRADLVILLLEYFMRGQITCSVTGRQGSGKTTLLKSLIRYIDPRYTIRVLELAPELYLRELYPTRNILSVQETATVSAAELQDALKKSDAAVSIVGEVATDEIASRMIQMGQVASIFTVFTHHANTAKDLVLSLRNSLVHAGGFNNSQTAEKQVTDIVKIDIHLDYTADGKRYIDRISEIVQLEEGIPYPELDANDPNSMNKITAEYYKRTTDRLDFYTHDILKYDLNTDTYYVCDRLSDKLEEYIHRNLGKDLSEAFDLFMLQNWGPKKGTPEASMSESELQSKLTELSLGIKNNNVVSNVNNNSIKDDNLTSEQILENAQDKAVWANEYSHRDDVQADQNEEFKLGKFFNDSDYK